MTEHDVIHAELHKKLVCVQNHDYQFTGMIVSHFMKRNGKSWRCVVEDASGLLLIQSAKNLEFA